MYNDMRHPDKEMWRPVKEWKNVYEVSSWGRVRSLERTVVTTDGQRRVYHGHLLQPWIDPKDRCYVALGKKLTKVARLVAETFLKNPEGYRFVIHKNRNLLDNHMKNLLWSPYSDVWHQRADAEVSSLIIGQSHLPKQPPLRPPKPFVRLQLSQQRIQVHEVPFILDLHRKGKTFQEIARMYHVPKREISRICMKLNAQ